jgi:VanZ family protein
MGLCVCLLAVNLAFIWGNSLLPGEISGALSKWVHTLVSLIFPNGGEESQGHGLLRKLAHFSEFCALGMVLSWLFAMLKEKRWAFVLPSLACGCLTACADETIQRFVPDRGPSIKDVMIDLAGVILGIVLLCLGYTIHQKKKKH